MRVMLTGGGTGGHIFPLLAVVEQLRAANQECEFHWFGSRRLELEVVPHFGLCGTYVPFTFSYRRLSLRALSYYLLVIPAWLIGFPVWMALWVLHRFAPDIVLSSGGYVSVPMLLAARIAGVPTALVEINAVPGRVSVLFSPFAQRVYCATDAIATQMARYAAPATLAVTGYPASERHETRATRQADFALPEDRPLVIVVGGSSGAESVNRLMAEVCANEDFASRMGSRISILHQWGYRPAPDALAAFARWPHYRPLDFHPCLAQLYSEAALFIGRAGAATIGELVRARLPAALIPYPHHADRQQYLNAEVLAHTGAAVILEEDEPGVADRLRELIERVALGEEDAAMRKGYESLLPNGAQTIAADIRAHFGGGQA